MEVEYHLEIDYDYMELYTNTTEDIYTTLEAAKRRIEQAKKEGKYECYRLYKVTKELLNIEENENIPNMG
jgi:hypothetical protein